MYYTIIIINIHYTVYCDNLTAPNNGTYSCSLGYDGVPSYKDTCNFTCNIGYELTGSDTRTCRSDGGWSGTQTMCRRSMFIFHLCMIASLL